MIRFEQTFMNFLLEHQERQHRTGHFLILMDAVISAARHIQYYYLTGALKDGRTAGCALAVEPRAGDSRQQGQRTQAERSALIGRH